jgi:predicted tellurium resistance membrane protein TerC
MADDRRSKLLIVFGLFVLLFNFPVLAIVDRAELWFGLPALYFYLFFVWSVLIVTVGLIVRKRK